VRLRMSSRKRRVISHIAALVVWGLLSGLVLAIAVFPVAAVSGLAAREGADSFQELPTDLSMPPLPQTTRLLASDGQTVITTFYEENRQIVDLEQISQYMRDAIVAAEDNRFYEHHGVDLRGVVRALVSNSAAGEVTQGASTLTMQYVRQALTYLATTEEERRAATEDTPARKISEIRYAIDLEDRLSKEEILENYLNIAYFGNGAYGVNAASYTYFNKPPSELELEEAALLAALVRAPSAYDGALQNTQIRDSILDRRNWVLQQMARLDMVSEAEAEEAIATPITLNSYTPPNDCVGVPADHLDWGFFCDFFLRWWERQEEFGVNSDERIQLLRRGGFTIITSLDVRLQEIAINNIREFRDENSEYALGVVFVEPGTGRVRSMAVNRFYSNDQSANPLHSNPDLAEQGVRANYPNTTNQLLGGGDLGYQAGSTFKIFPLVAALEQGMTLSQTYDSPTRYASRFPGERGSPASCQVNGRWRWCPSNSSESMAGRHNMWSGFGGSVNTYFVQLIEDVTPPAAVEVAERMGLTWHNDHDQGLADNANNWGAFTLGVADTTPLEMANAYATLAADGVYCAPLPINEIRDVDGEVLDMVQPSCQQVLDPDVARAATDAARCPVGDRPQAGSCAGRSTARVVGEIVDRPVAGKTGTTDNYQAGWFVGYTMELAGAAFIADPDYRENAVGSRSTEPTRLWARTVDEYLGSENARNFPPPPRYLVR